MNYTRGEWAFYRGTENAEHTFWVGNHINHSIATNIKSQDDAQLIASAPDLYEACKSAYAFIEMCAFEESQTKEMQILARALAKAKGSEQ